MKGKALRKHRGEVVVVWGEVVVVCDKFMKLCGEVVVVCGEVLVVWGEVVVVWVKGVVPWGEVVVDWCSVVGWVAVVVWRRDVGRDVVVVPKWRYLISIWTLWYFVQNIVAKCRYRFNTIYM